MFRCSIVIFVIIFLVKIVNGQSDYIVITHISIHGNLKTKAEAIMRELDIKINDTIQLTLLPNLLLENEKRLLSTGLFSEVDVNIKNWVPEQTGIHIDIFVKEGWFIYPYVIFALADRNFNVWAQDFKYSIQRINFGLAMTHINFTGGKDKLKAKFQFGYTGKYELYYEYPYIKNGWGFSANLFYADNKEISYKTINNRPQFFKATDERNLLRQVRGLLAVSKRTSAFSFHTARIEYFYGSVDPEIPLLFNTDYFLQGNTFMGYLRIEYEFIYNKLRYPLYPEEGYKWKVNVRKDGISGTKGIDNTSLAVEYSKHWNWVRSLIFSTKFKIKGNIQRNKIPYFNNQAIGYGPDEITGYQLYIIDGTDFMYSKNALKYRIFEKDFQFKKWVPKKFRPFNTQIFLRLNFDVGYVNEPFYKEGNQLANSVLYGYGPAVDLIFFHNMVMSFDFSVNRNKEHGFYISGGFQF